MLKILKNTSVEALFSGIGELTVSKTGSVKVTITLGGKPYRISRNAIAEKVDMDGSDIDKITLYNLFKEIENQVQQQLGGKRSFKRFSHSIKSFFGKSKFSFRKMMKRFDFKTANKAVENEDWETVDFYLKFREKLPIEEVRKILSQVIEKNPPHKEKYFIFLGDLTENKLTKPSWYLAALDLKSSEALAKLEAFYPLNRVYNKAKEAKEAEQREQFLQQAARTSPLAKLICENEATKKWFVHDLKNNN